MYIPEHFEVKDRQEIFAFIKANALGQFISIVEDRLFSSHIPFLISKDEYNCKTWYRFFYVSSG